MDHSYREEILNGRYYKISKILMEILGLWPYKSNFRRRMSHFLFYIIPATLLIPEFIMVPRINFVTFAKNGMSCGFVLYGIMKYTLSYFSREQFSQVLEQIVEDWKKITDKEERNILIKYNEQGRQVVVIYTFAMYCSWFSYNSLLFIPLFLNIILPLENGSHPEIIPFVADYFLFYSYEYHYETCLHAIVIYFMVASLINAVDTLYIAIVKHVCGLFAIVCYRLETIGKLDQCSKGDGSLLNFKRAEIVNRELGAAVLLHNEVMRCCNLLEDAYSTSFLYSQAAIVAALVFGMFFILLVFEDLMPKIQMTGFFCGSVVHIFFLHWAGQLIIDSSMVIFNSAYFSDWYLIPPNCRKLVNIIMSRSITHCQLISGKLIPLSMNSFGSIMKTSLSYYTVLMSVGSY